MALPVMFSLFWRKKKFLSAEISLVAHHYSTHSFFLFLSFFPSLTPSLSLAELKIGAGGRELEKE